MEAYDIDNIGDIITDWWFTNNDDMDMLALELIEFSKQDQEGTFDFVFNHNGKEWHLKFECSSYYFESDAEDEEDLVTKCNDAIMQLDDDKGICQDDPNEAVLVVLQQALVKILQDEKKRATKGEDDDMNVDRDEDGFEIDDDEGEGGAGWSDEDYEIEDQPLVKNTSSVNNEITKYNISLGSKDSIKIFSKLRVVKEAKHVQELIEFYLKDIPETFQVQVFEPLLMFKLTIDLNFLSVSPHTFESLGFDMEELVEYLFIFDDNKILMFLTDPSIMDMTMEDLCKLGILKVEFLQQSNELSQNRYQSYLQLLHESFFNKSKDGVSIAEEIKTLNDEDLKASKATLLEMGFSWKESEKALIKNKFSVQGAINYLIGRKKDTKKGKTVEEDDVNDFSDIDPKHMLFSNITGLQLKENMVLNYLRYIIYSLDSIQEY